MATPKSPAKFRSWSSMDSIDPADIRRLYDPESSSKSSSVRCVSTWMFSLLILGSTVLFLIGLLVGYYVRESQNLDSDRTIGHCYYGERSDGFSKQQLESAHENIMYSLSSENINAVKSEFSFRRKLTSNSGWDENTVSFVKSEFTKYGLDKISVEEYDVVVTYPNPVQPNRLEVITSAGQVKLNLTFGSGQRSSVDKKKRGADDVEEMRKHLVEPYVAFAPSGTVQGALVYGHYGRMVDLVQVNKSGVTLKNKILILRLGKLAVTEKLALAAQWGAVGVLLYIDPADLGGTVDRVTSPDLQKFVPYVSAGGKVYTANPYGVSIVPAQTVSIETATFLMSSLIEPSAPASWNGGLNATYRLQGQHTVRLIVNNIKKVETVRNVVGVIEGDIEGDRNIMVGAARTGGSQTESMVSMGTINMLELARSIASIRRLEKWLPRRGIKFYSWGGAQFSHSGIEEYLKENRLIVQTKAVAYLDLDLYMRRSDSLRAPKMDVTTSHLLSTLVEKVSTVVPDAAFSELTIKDSLSLTVNEYRKSISATDYLHGNQGSLFLFQELGIPVFKSGFDLPGAMIKNGSLHDSEHHYRYHLAAARVMALVILNLVDENILPLDVAGFASSIDEAMIQTADLKDMSELIDNLVITSDVFLTTGKAFEVYIESLGPNKVPLEARRVNDALMMLDKVFLSPLINR
ncbi:N-acetylated-alpha-linked acidic dipeptidase-like protein [Mizuhopecten yessoensis]|uniref:N-acetylated-alpha-linked acidic dipeptidase-like protein n=2 Tax=Mizuhopecten yessoensis TaxID=6573 RepID=A0A210QT46_MIZYE|nr:N-acetylated-alpha-linked acidic dipeptidase-like protein [Mizuhopecten yessoensis]